MNVHLLPTHSSEHITRAATLYESAFPPEERRPTEKWVTLLGNTESPVTLHIIADENDNFCGFITLWTLNGFTYAEHFAILPEMRGHGIGGQIFRQLLEHPSHTPLILEVEPAEDSPNASRRIRFYEQHGMHLLSHPYMQPPYSAEFSPLPLCLMASTDSLTDEQLNSMVRELHKEVYHFEA